MAWSDLLPIPGTPSLTNEYGRFREQRGETPVMGGGEIPVSEHADQALQSQRKGWRPRTVAKSTHKPYTFLNIASLPLLSHAKQQRAFLSLPVGIPG